MTASIKQAVDLFLTLDPLVPGEDRAAYEALRQSMHQALEPADAVERIWTQEAVVLTWELARIERLRTDILTRGRADVLREILLRPLPSCSLLARQNEKVIKRYLERDPGGDAAIERLLHEKGYTTLVITRAYGENLSRLEILDKMASRTEYRRARLLREVGRRKDFARRVQAFTRPPSPSGAPPRFIRSPMRRPSRRMRRGAPAPSSPAT